MRRWGWGGVSENLQLEIENHQLTIMLASSLSAAKQHISHEASFEPYLSEGVLRLS